MIERVEALSALKTALANNPVAVLLGPRQCGKTTLARALAKERPAVFFDLERPSDRAKLQQPELLLGGLKGLVVIDEVQRLPELFTVLRPLADRPKSSAKFLLLGSASPDLVKGVSETLAGRAGFVDLGGFDLRDVGAEKAPRLWLRGGFPRAFLARDEAASLQWRGRISFARFWNATCRPWVSGFLRRRCFASGRWWRIITGRFGTARNWRAGWDSPRRRCGAIWTFSPGRLC
jgi:hypothetical protein